MVANTNFNQLLEEAKQFVDNQQYSSAIANYEKALQIDPNNKMVFYNLGWTYNLSGDLLKAEDYYQKALTADATYADAYNGLGVIYYTQKKYELAIKNYDLALQHDPRHSYALKNLGLAYRSKGEFQKEIDCYRRLLKLDPAFAADIYNYIGNIYTDDLKDYKQAIVEYETAIKLENNNKYALYNLGRVWNILNQPEQSINFYQRAVQADPKYTDAYNAIGNFYADEKHDYEQAMQQYQLAIKIDPNYKRTYFNMGRLFAMKKDFKSAKQCYEKAISIDASYTDAYNGKAIAHRFLGEFDESIASYKKTIELDENYAEAYNGLGAVYEDMKDFKKAEEQYLLAIQKNSKHKYALGNIGNLYLRTGRIGEATKYYQLAVDADPNYADAYFGLGNIYLDQLNYVKAREYFDLALKATPNYVYAQHNKAWLYEKLGQYKKSKEEWVKAKDDYKKIVKEFELKQNDLDLAAKYFYYAQILSYYINETDPDYSVETIINHYKQAIAADSNSVYYRFYLLKFYLDQKAILQNKKQNPSTDPRQSESLQTKINEYHIQVLHEYRTAVSLLKERIEKQKTTSDLAELGEFYIAMEEYKSAADVFEQAIGLDENFTRGYVGLGVAQSKMNTYTEAIRNFKKALTFDPDDLNVKSNLADAYLKSENLSSAEETYNKILAAAPCHLDALIGLAEHHKLVGDDMADNKNLQDAEDYFKQAIRLYDDLINKNKDFTSVPRKLNTQELSSINYSIGYAKAKLYEIDQGLGLRALAGIGKASYLQSALKCFRQITEDQPDFYKAQTAIKKIRKQFGPATAIRRKFAPALVFILALLVCLGAQFLFWVGRPSQKEVFTVNRNNMTEFIKQNKMDFALPGLNQVTAKKFTSIKDLQDDLKKATAANDSLMQRLATIPTIEFSQWSFEPIDSVTYASITFGALIFMVVGLYLGNISKLKVGYIELEKTTSDTIATSPNLGISR